ncbi:hypothetical protein GCM10009795_019670 [Nocardioides hankookensis]|uniref:Uncharacterized protein n=1 Tax=Nocardioides hankookensis TaxID=443157 RepID=A0ABW1LJJ7_9ACTN
MRRTSTALALTVALLAATLSPIAPSQADVGVSQQAKLVGDMPVAGRYSIAYNDYGPDRGSHCGPKTGVCEVYGRPVARGKLQTKLSVYKIKDGIKKYDYYLLDVDMVTADRYGTWRMGGVGISVTSIGPKVVDHIDTKSLSASKGSCDEVKIGFQTPWPVISASTDLGTVTWCDDEASLKSLSAGNWVLTGIGSTRHLAVDRAVKVLAGKKPRFRIDLSVPKDTCTRVEDKKCRAFDNGAASATYRVGSSG